MYDGLLEFTGTKWTGMSSLIPGSLVLNVCINTSAEHPEAIAVVNDLPMTYVGIIIAVASVVLPDSMTASLHGIIVTVAWGNGTIVSDYFYDDWKMCVK